MSSCGRSKMPSVVGILRTVRNGSMLGLLRTGFMKMPRVVPDQREKFENDELFRRLSRETEVRRSYTYRSPRSCPVFPVMSCIFLLVL